MIRSMDLVFIHGQMEDSTTACGKMVNSMVKVSTYCLQVFKEEVNGRMDIGKDGSMQHHIPPSRHHNHLLEQIHHSLSASKNKVIDHSKVLDSQVLTPPCSQVTSTQLNSQQTSLTFKYELLIRPQFYIDENERFK